MPPETAEERRRRLARNRARRHKASAAAFAALNSVAQTLAGWTSPARPVAVPASVSGRRVGSVDQLQKLDDRLEQYDALNDIEEYTGIRKAHLLILAAAAAMAFILFGFGSSALCLWIGFLYPIYASFRCLESDDPGKSDVSSWLMYWVVFGVFQMSEVVADSFLSSFPFYYPLKVVFVLWCLLPGYRGANTLYSSIVDPCVMAVEPRLGTLWDDICSIVDSATHDATRALRSSLTAIESRISTH
ncbi:Receptor expression-enhancing protein [Plasmodiophora brassicae]